jgi:DNA-binding GntR family transcriptional regulator
MMTKTRRAHEDLIQRIEGLSAHTMLPREVDLAMELQVSRSTLRQVLGGLSRL